MDIGKRVFTLRTAHCLTQERLGQMTGLSAKYISMIETGRRVPGHLILLSLSRAFGVTVDYLITGEVPAPSPDPVAA